MRGIGTPDSREARALLAGAARSFRPMQAAAWLRDTISVTCAEDVRAARWLGGLLAAADGERR